MQDNNDTKIEIFTLSDVMQRSIDGKFWVSPCLDDCQKQIHLSNVNPITNPMYKHMNMSKLLAYQINKHSPTPLHSPQGTTRSKAIVINESYITRQGAYDPKINLFRPRDSAIKQYSKLFKPTGYLSDLGLLMSDGIVGLHLSPADGREINIEYNDNDVRSSVFKSNTVFIDIAMNSNLELTEVFPTYSSCNSITKIVYIIREGATVTLRRYFCGAYDNSFQLLDSEFILHPESSLKMHVSSTAADYMQDTYNITCYEKSNLDFKGIYKVEKEYNSHVVTNVHHVGKDSRSRVEVRSTADDNSWVTFAGNIKVDKKATGTDAELSNKNLQLSDKTIINTEPKLEIATKDIQCSHGCTVSNIDPNQLYFLESKGLEPSRAKSFIAEAFLNV